MKMHDLNWPNGIDVVTDPDANRLAQKLARQVAQWLAEALVQRGSGSLAVSGGRTPITFFDALSHAEIDWSQVIITLADERWVAPDHADSNERLVREHLLQGRAAAAGFVGLKQGTDSATDGQSACETALAAIPWPLDVLVLGMGSDGHTASLFPDAPELEKALDPANAARCIAVHPPSVSQARMSLTKRALAESRHIALHLEGTSKLETLEAVLGNPPAVSEMPIRAFLQPGLQVYWSP